jgi:hypothetical protein
LAAMTTTSALTPTSRRRTGSERCAVLQMRQAAGLLMVWRLRMAAVCRRCWEITDSFPACCASRRRLWMLYGLSATFVKDAASFYTSAAETAALQGCACRCCRCDAAYASICRCG